MNKKLLCSVILFLSIFSLFSQVIDYTGNVNPYTKLSQKEKDEKLIEICNKYYSQKNDNLKIEKIAKLLLQAGANPNAEYNDKSLLHLAIINGNHNISKLLIDNKANLKYVSKDGESIIYLMIDENFSLEEIEYALQMGAPFPSKNSKSNKSPLSEAAASGNFELLKLCISKGCKPSDVLKDDPPPVFFALRNGDIKSVEYLIEHGDNINKPFEVYENVITYSLHQTLICTDSGKGYAELEDGVITRALELGANPFLESTYGNAFSYSTDILLRGYKQPQKIKNIMELYNNMDKYLPKKYTKTLYEAFLSGDTKALKTNIENYKKENNPHYVYEFASYCEVKNKKENISFLISSGIKPTYSNLLYAVSYSEDMSFIKMLISQIDLKNGTESYKHDFLSYCHSNYHNLDSEKIEFLIRVLLDNGFTPETMIYDEDIEKEIPLFFFVCLHMSNRNQKPIEVLLKNGANINAKWNGKTVLDILNPNYHSDVIDYLKNNGL